MMLFKKLNLFLCLIAVVLIGACSEEDASNKVIYKVIFESNWSAEVYPDSYPTDAGFSPFVAFSHADYIEFFDTETLASPGLKALAENGSLNPLDQEIQDLIDAGNATDLTTSTRINAPGIAFTELEITEENSTVSFVSKITPSPDWFVAVKNVNLFENGEWVDKVESVVPFDAGTILGDSFYATEATPRTTPVYVNELTEGALINNIILNSNTSNFGIVRFERIN